MRAMPYSGYVMNSQYASWYTWHLNNEQIGYDIFENMLKTFDIVLFLKKYK